MTGPAPDGAFWEALEWQPSPDQLQQFIELQKLLREWNSRVNLTRLVDGDDYWVSQVYDSLWPLDGELRVPEQTRHCIDVGTGGGFPGLAVAIALPGARVMLLDSVGRKTAAVQAMAASLGLSDRVTVRTERIEITAHERNFRGQFDLAMARAVAAAPVVAEYLVPLLNTQGQALIYRGQWAPEDAASLGRALKTLKAELHSVQRCQLPGERGTRHMLRVQPVAPCPKTYPRAVGTPGREPLGV